MLFDLGYSFWNQIINPVATAWVSFQGDVNPVTPRIIEENRTIERKYVKIIAFKYGLSRLVQWLLVKTAEISFNGTSESITTNIVQAIFIFYVEIIQKRTILESHKPNVDFLRNIHIL